MTRRLWIPTLLLFILLSPCALAEQADYAEKIVDGMDLTALKEAAGVDLDLDIRQTILDLASGTMEADVGEALEELKLALAREWRGILPYLPGMLLPALIGTLAAHFSRERTLGALQYVCRLACALAAAGLLRRMLAQADEAMRRTAALAEALFPLLAALLSASGAANTASLLTPSAALLNRLIIELFSGAGLRLCGVAAAVSVAGGIHSRITLKGLFALLSDVVNWTAGIVVTAFLGFLSVQRLLGGGYDSASVRAARYAVDNLLPVIGGDVADTLDVVISSVRLVKNALGVTGMLLALGLCAGPVAAIGLALISMRVLAAVTEPLAEDGLSRMMEQFAKVMRMLLVLDSACATLLLLLLGASLAAGGKLSG